MQRVLLFIALVALAFAQRPFNVIDTYAVASRVIVTPDDRESNVTHQSDSFIGGERFTQATFVSGNELQMRCAVTPSQNPMAIGNVFSMSSDTGFIGSCSLAYSAVGGGPFDPPEDFVQFGGDCWLIVVGEADNENTIFITTRTPAGIRSVETSEARNIQRGEVSFCLPAAGDLEEYRNVTSFELSARGTGIGNSVDLRINLVCFASRVSCWHEFSFPGINDPPQTGDDVMVTLICVNLASNATTYDIDFPFPSASGNITSGSCSGGNAASIVDNALVATDITLAPDGMITCEFDVVLTGEGNTGPIQANIFNQDSTATSRSHGMGQREGVQLCEDGVPSNFTIDPAFCPPFAFDPLVTANYRLLNSPDGVESPPPYCLRLDHILHDGAVTPPGAVLFDCTTGTGLVVGISGMDNAVRISGSVMGGEKDPDTGVIVNPSLLTVDIVFRDFVPSNGGIATNDSQAIGTIMFRGETWFIRGKSGPPVLYIRPRGAGGSDITLAGWLEFSRNDFGPYTAVSVNDFLGLIGECIDTRVDIPDRAPIAAQPTMAVPTGPPTIAPTATPTTRAPALVASCPIRSCSDCSCSMCPQCANAACSRCDFDSPACERILTNSGDVQIGPSRCIIVSMSAVVGDITGTDGDDCVRVETGGVVRSIDLGDGDDCVDAPSAIATTGGIRTGDGNDHVHLITPLEVASVDTAEGDDCVEIDMSGDSNTQLLTGTGDDCVRMVGGEFGDINTSSGDDCIGIMTTLVTGSINSDVGSDCLVLGGGRAVNVDTGDSDTGDTLCASLVTLSGTMSTGNTNGENCVILTNTNMQSFSGGEGDDVVIMTRASSAVGDIDLNGGNDFLAFNVSSRANTLSGGDGEDIIIATGSIFNSAVGNDGNDCLEATSNTGRISGGTVNVNGGGDIDLCVADSTARLFDCE